MDTIKWTELVLLLFTITSSTTQAAKVLLLPMNMGSHLLYFGQVASALAEHGHEPTLYIASNNQPPAGLSSKVKVAVYNAPGDVPFGNSVEFAASELAILNAGSMWEWVEKNIEHQMITSPHWETDCAALHELDTFQDISSVGYDIAIIDPIMYSCHYTIPYKLNIPYISLSVPIINWGYRVAHLPTLWPNVGTTSGERMNFWDRLTAFTIDVLETVFTNNTNHFVRKYVPEKRAVGAGELLINSSMWWYLYDLSVGYPKATMPNTLNIGDIMVRPTKPLAEEFMKIMHESKFGVIYASLGSHFDAVPEAWLKQFCAAFNALNYTVIWKLKVAPPCEPKPHVYIKAWLPQNDLLAQPKLVLFITHAGYNSILEAVSHAKPMLAFPISLDQPYNAQLLKNKGLGEILRIKSFKAHELTEAVERILAPSAKYTQNARRAAQLLRKKPESPAARVSYWLDHVLEFGTSHMRSAASDLTILQFLMIDIYVFLLLVVIVLVVFVLLLMVCTWKCLRGTWRRFCARTKPHKD